MPQPKKENQRYSGPASVKQSFMNEFLVECPKCKKDALVQTNGWYLSGDAKLNCTHCLFFETTASRIRYQALVKRNCDHCGKAIRKKIPNLKKPAVRVKSPCPHCGTVRVMKPNNEPYLLLYKDSGSAADPVFNLPLCLQTNVKGHPFWAYNRRHLQAIKQYTTAKLRERQAIGYTTMVEKLPQFIKDAKNRRAILKAIAGLE
ncbi:MAG: hypothetical protein NTW29_06345 [Bacteroidetes bacterium]|nr:hypothetical protein [Bacteroidota bacterium]